MTTNLSAALVDVDLRIYPASPHGFTGHRTAMAQVALDDIETWLSGHFGRELSASMRLGSMAR